MPLSMHIIWAVHKPSFFHIFIIGCVVVRLLCVFFQINVIKEAIVELFCIVLFAHFLFFVLLLCFAF